MSACGCVGVLPVVRRGRLRLRLVGRLSRRDLRGTAAAPVGRVGQDRQAGEREVGDRAQLADGEVRRAPGRRGRSGSFSTSPAGRPGHSVPVATKSTSDLVARSQRQRRRVALVGGLVALVAIALSKAPVKKLEERVIEPKATPEKPADGVEIATHASSLPIVLSPLEVPATSALRGASVPAEQAAERDLDRDRRRARVGEGVETAGPVAAAADRAGRARSRRRRGRRRSSYAKSLVAPSKRSPKPRISSPLKRGAGVASTRDADAAEADQRVRADGGVAECEPVSSAGRGAVVDAPGRRRWRLVT